MPSLLTVQKGLDCGVVKSLVVRVAVKLQSCICTAIGNASDLGDNFSGLSTCSSYWHGHQTPTVALLLRHNKHRPISSSSKQCHCGTLQENKKVFLIWCDIEWYYVWYINWYHISCATSPSHCLVALFYFPAPWMVSTYLPRGGLHRNLFRLWGRYFSGRVSANFWEESAMLKSVDFGTNPAITLWFHKIHTSRIRFRNYFAPDLTCKSVVCYQCLTIKLLFSMLNRNFPSFTSHFEFFNPHCHMSNPVKSPLMLAKSYGFSCLDPYFCPVNPFPRRGLGGKLGQKLRSALHLEPEAFSVFLGLICHIWL